MKSGALAATLGPFSALAVKNASANMYKTLEVSPDTIKGCGLWGVLEADVTLGNTETFWVDTAHFIGLIKSLPNDEIDFELTDKTLQWTCGNAQGKLALRGPIDLPVVTWTELEDAWQPGPNTVYAIELGSLSMGPADMASQGIYGIAFDNVKSGLYVTSTDDVTMANCRLSDQKPDWPFRTTLLPAAADMLCSVLKQTGGEPRMNIVDSSVYASAGGFRLLLKGAQHLKFDILTQCAPYSDRQMVVKLDADRVNAFLKRANTLSEATGSTLVTFAAAADAIALSFAEGIVASDEFFPVDGLGAPNDLPDIKLDSAKVARVLAHTNLVAIDHIERGVLSFFSDGHKFEYLIMGVK